MKDARSSSRTESENKEPEEDTLERDLRGTSTTSEERTNSRTTGNEPRWIRLQPTGASTLTGRGFGRTGGRLATSINGFEYNQDEELDDWQQASTDSTTTKTGNSTRKAIKATGESTLTEGGSGRGFKWTFTQNRREEGTRGDTLGRDSTGTTIRGTSTTSEERTNSTRSGTEPQGIKLQPR
jgi:hypothetical protein